MTLSRDSDMDARSARIVADQERAEAAIDAERERPGWSDLGGLTRKLHYFPRAKRGTVALCGKWMIGREHPLQAEVGKPSPDDCVACRRKLDAGG